MKHKDQLWHGLFRFLLSSLSLCKLSRKVKVKHKCIVGDVKRYTWAQGTVELTFLPSHLMLAIAR